MIIYTNLNKLSVIFARLSDTAKQHKIELRYGLTCDLETIQIKQDKTIFWFSKSNAKSLVYYRVCESLESIYNGLQLLENHKELIK